ncbi:MAG: response regulator transcription factor [Bacteroides sp.]|nr:response regulator transcription factor [Bacteroides sp.]
MKHVTIAVVTPSQLLATGIVSTLSKLRDPGVTVKLFDGDHVTPEQIAAVKPSLAVVDTLALSPEAVARLKESCRVAGIRHSELTAAHTAAYDDLLNLYDPLSRLEAIVRETAEENRGEEDRQELSPREKEVIVGIVKGLSNKEIAAEINVSVNTVMTHRRNIASKLQIHSPAGLTIYAIVKKLVRLDEIRATIDS